MLKALFGSEPRVKILNLLLLHPELKYSLRQLAQNLNLPNPALRREIDSLQKSQIIKTAAAESGRTRFFIINQDFLLYPEIRALFMKAQILSSHNSITGLQKTGQLKLLLMTGLFTNYPEAVTDILVVGHIKRGAFLKLVKDLEKDLGREINFTILSEREFHYRQEMMDIFLYNILEGKNLILLDQLGLEMKKD
ncbi:MAG: hypothetical protein WC905_04650 [Patescibacteria group bacterium]|jgi:hypothetical protein